MQKVQKIKTKKLKRGFCVLDRERDLKLAVEAIATLREFKKREHPVLGLGLDGALQVVEPILNSILRFSSEKFPDELFDRVVPRPIPEDLSQARKTAAVEVKTLRKILKEARADLSVPENECTQLDNALDLVERKLNELLPPPGAPQKAILPFD